MEHSFKEGPLLDILIKKENGQIIKDIYHKPINTSTLKVTTSKLYKFIPYTLARRMSTIVTNKNFRKTCLTELCVTIRQIGNPTTLKALK